MQLYKLYCDGMIIVAQRYVKDRALAEDAMQEAYPLWDGRGKAPAVADADFPLSKGDETQGQTIRDFEPTFPRLPAFTGY